MCQTSWTLHVRKWCLKPHSLRCASVCCWGWGGRYVERLVGLWVVVEGGLEKIFLKSLTWFDLICWMVFVGVIFLFKIKSASIKGDEWRFPPCYQGWWMKGVDSVNQKRAQGQPWKIMVGNKELPSVCIYDNIIAIDSGVAANIWNSTVHPLKLTACTWKWMVGILVSFWVSAHFQVLC